MIWKTPQYRILKPGNNLPRKREMICSISRYRIFRPDRRTKRGKPWGIVIRPTSGSSSFFFSIIRAMVKPKLGRKGNGCAGSIATGVRTENTSPMKYRSSHFKSLSDRDSGDTTFIPAFRNESRSSTQRICCRLIKSAVRSFTARICRIGVNPSALRAVTPARTWPFRTATRTAKNSLRLLSEIDRKRRRSRSG